MSKTVGNYVIQSKVGSGSYAQVYKAVHKSSGEIFAIKMIAKEKLGNDERLYTNLESEIRIMRDYIHPNVVRLYENLTSGRNIYLILEYCPGGDLTKFIRKTHHLSDMVARVFFVQLVDGLSFLHSRNVIHRDIKPQNILLTESSAAATIKIADFGFAKHLTEAAMAQTPCGTPLYMAPEIFQMKDYNEKADLWSLGCVYYEMLVGTTPFRGSSPKELYTNIQTKALVVPPELGVSRQTETLLRKVRPVPAPLTASQSYAWMELYVYV
jgi:serine/threonine-protein kinase ULK2